MKTKRGFIGQFDKKHFRVAIFGSARIKKDTKEYKQIYKIAEMLGKRGIDVVTGGGPGLMEAANSGHKAGSTKNHARSIGLGIKLPKEQRFNESVDFKKLFYRFSKRLDNFMLLSHAVIVSQGGVGTMLEFFYTWQLVQVKHACNIPIILVGDMWKDLIKWLKKYPLKKGYFNEEELKMIYCVKNVEEAINIIDEAKKEFNKNKKDFCLNYEKYRIIK